MQGSDAFVRELLKIRELKKVGMKVDDVEIVGPAPNSIQHHEVAGDEIADAG